jgi:hypothetical protein
LAASVTVNPNGSMQSSLITSASPFVVDFSP